MVPLKNNNIKRFWRKKTIEDFYGSSSLKSEKVQGREVLAMKIKSSESLHFVL